MPHFLTPLLDRPRATWGLCNVTRGTWVATALTPAFDAPSRRRGLLLHDGIDAAHALVLAPTSAIHTFFMTFAIDVLFVARDGRVVKIRESMGPGRMSGAWRAFAVVELAAGRVAACGTRAGDVLLAVPSRAGSMPFTTSCADFHLGGTR
jgi:uncharacterized membrane protein (UPF0127 family)